MDGGRKITQLATVTNEPSRGVEIVGSTVLHTRFCSLPNISKKQPGASNPDMTTEFHTRPYGRFIEIKSNASCFKSCRFKVRHAQI